MRTGFWLILVLAAAGVGVAGCTPLVVGGAAVVVADEVMEQEGGGDGLF
jgi:hypothetical protein